MLAIDVADSNCVTNRTSSMPKSVLHFELDKDSTSNWKLPSTNLVPQIKYCRMDVLTLSSFLRPILTVFFGKTGETGDIDTNISFSHSCRARQGRLTSVSLMSGGRPEVIDAFLGAPI